MKHRVVSRHSIHYHCKSPKYPEASEPAEPEIKEKIKREKTVPDKTTGTTVVALVREYLSDILGAFIPGVYFSFYLFSSMALLWAAISGPSWHGIISAIEKHGAILSHIAPFALFAFCLFSYIIGSAFCRKDIKEPDMASAKLTYRKTEPEDRNGLDFDIAPDDPPYKTCWAFLAETVYWYIGLSKKKRYLVDFPYLYLNRYLEHRNYHDLAKRIPWSGNKEETFQRRSKTFINRLKSRINHYAPAEMQVIEKNEAHIRMMNSLWYAAKSIRNICLLIFPIIIALYTLNELTSVFRYIFPSSCGFANDVTFFLVFFSLVQLCVAGYIRRSIKQYFHYMRDREIMFILEIADTISRKTGIDMFEGMEP
jgi:hypothetical protein